MRRELTPSAALSATDAVILVDLDDLAAHATSDLAQLALLVGRGLFDGADAEVDNRFAHGSASRFEMSNYTMHCVEKQSFLHTPKPISERAGFVELMNRIFVRVFPYAPNRQTPFADSAWEQVIPWSEKGRSAQRHDDVES